MKSLNSLIALAAGCALLTSAAFAQTETPADEPPAAAVVEQAAPETTTTDETPADPAAEAPAAAPEPAVLGEPPAGQGQIVFFRPPRFVAGGLSYSVREGDTGIGRLGSGRYFIHNTNPGIHEYNITGETTDTLRLEIEEGEVYYVLQTVNVGNLTGRPTLTPTTEANFQRNSQNLRPSTMRGVDRRQHD